jgi:DegV family protein with EDD domain
MQIVTDCAADMPKEELEALGITQAPLYIQFPDGEVSSTDIAADAFYDRLEAMQPEIPTTAMPSSGLLEEIYSSIAGMDRDILSLHISSGLSGTINAARGAAEQLRQRASVSFWDTLTLSGGQRFQVITAALAAKAGWSLSAIQERLATVRARTEVVYTLDTLDYLARGGRIGRVKALAGALLHLKPIIRVDSDGKYSSVGSSRTIGKSMATITEHLRSRYGSTPLWVTVLHGRFADKADELSTILRQALTVKKLEVMRISPVLGVHTGPHVVGAAVMPSEYMEDLW